MSKTKIEWVKNPDGSQGETINPVKGLCPVGCSYCYARAMYKRFKWDPEIRFDNKAWRKILYDIESYKNPSRIFVGSTIELFGEWVEMSTQNLLFKELPSWFPQHTPDY